MGGEVEKVQTKKEKERTNKIISKASRQRFVNGVFTMRTVAPEKVFTRISAAPKGVFTIFGLRS